MMKKRAFLPLASLVVLSGIAAVSGTMAWFQTNRSISLSFSDAEIRSRDSSLNVKLIGSANTLDPTSTQLGGVASDSGNYDIQLKTLNDAFLTDISGNGLAFHKLETGYRLNDNDDKLEGISWQIPLSIEEITTVKADGHFLDFTLELSRTQLTEGYSDDLLVYLGSGTKIAPAHERPSDFGDLDAEDQAEIDAQIAKDVAAVDASRMSIIDVTEADADDHEVVALYAPTAEPETFTRWTGNNADGSPIPEPDFVNTPLYTYLAKGEASDSAYQVAGYKIVDFVADDSGTVLTGAFADKTTYVGSETAAAGMIAELDSDDSIKLNFRVWIEGTDSDAGLKVGGNDPIGGKIRLSLDLYTLQRPII